MNCSKKNATPYIGKKKTKAGRTSQKHKYSVSSETTTIEMAQEYKEIRKRLVNLVLLLKQTRLKGYEIKEIEIKIYQKKEIEEDSTKILLHRDW